MAYHCIITRYHELFNQQKFRLLSMIIFPYCGLITKKQENMFLNHEISLQTTIFRTISIDIYFFKGYEINIHIFPGK